MTRVHIWMRSEDVTDIRAIYGDTIGFSRAVQQMVALCLRQVREKAALKATPIRSDVDLDTLT